ncbi:RNA-directed DNA polymerase [Shewanella sp. SG41-3]|uniref:RNA-directed DNA polymerase n=1 Tax=Shewanella sp. SG41-3 TaxID=2760977 RepID=UPI001C723F44|nr:RNA-directed DNA polymerase [Shewanella sp. SG41-3]
MKLIINMTAEEASEFLLKHESYCNFPLPPYFDFSPILLATKVGLDAKQNGLNDIGLKKASDFDNVNYILQTNKDGHYAWRPFQLIHPALYVHLVSKITEDENWNLIKDRFEYFNSNEKICIASIPRKAGEKSPSDTAESVMGWWNDVEQLSIEKSLDFKYIFHTDIANFYPSIYTHSVSWAIHTKETAKIPNNRSKISLIGVSIDKTIQHMQNGQTNGIPQGSVLMDFIAEIVLGYADSELTKKLNFLGVEDYYIIRYRDDYRVFTNSKEDNEAIARQITLTLQDLGLQLNASKTSSSEDVVLNSIKDDKLEALSLFNKNQSETTIQKSLLKLVMFSRKYPNSGQLSKQLAKLSKKLETKKTLKENPRVIVSIITDIMINNPRTFASCALVLSKALKFIDNSAEKLELLKKIRHKFKPILGTGVLDIWLQRISYSIQPDIEFNEPLCNITANVQGINIWESDWITDNNFKTNCLSTSIINRDTLAKCDAEISEDEVVLFPYDIEFHAEDEEYS